MAGGRGGAIQVDGARQLRASLKRAGLDVQDLKDAHRAIADLVLADATPPRDSGRLAGSSRAAGTAREALLRAGGARVRYAGPIHWGWPARNIAPQPWLYDAVRRNEDPALDVYLDALDAILAKIEGTHTP